MLFRSRDILTTSARRTPEQVAVVFDHWRTTVSEFSAANAQLEALWAQFPEGTTAYALVARTEERMTSVLNRGDWLKPTSSVKPGVPAKLVVDAAALPFAEIAIVIRCVDAPEAVERLPEPRSERILGVSVPVFDLWPREPAAPVKIRRMMQSLGVQS